DEWRAARHSIRAAQKQQKNPASPSRVLVISGADRNDGSCPSEMSKTFRLSRIVIRALERSRIECDDLDLSRTTSEYGKQIHPCKGCVSTAMPLCHWPCSCYPNHSLGQTNDWMNEIYPRWAAAHGIVIVTPVYWYQAPSALKLMMDRLVCADGGNPDPSSTQGKDAKKAKQIELAGWPYPKHLAGRTYGLVVHGDVGGIEGVRRSLSDWLDWMGLIDAGSQARLDRYIGYYEPYATSHDALDQDKKLHEEVRNVARAVAKAVRELRAGTLSQPDRGLESPRPK
ncbi:MAG: flavodoxin family protein, partial [Burkholderiaceae bacterium]